MGNDHMTIAFYLKLVKEWQWHSCGTPVSYVLLVD